MLFQPLRQYNLPTDTQTDTTPFKANWPLPLFKDILSNHMIATDFSQNIPRIPIYFFSFVIKIQKIKENKKSTIDPVKINYNYYNSFILELPGVQHNQFDVDRTFFVLLMRLLLLSAQEKRILNGSVRLA